MAFITLQKMSKKCCSYQSTKILSSTTVFNINSKMFLEPQIIIFWRIMWQWRLE